MTRHHVKKKRDGRRTIIYRTEEKEEAYTAYFLFINLREKGKE